MTSDETDVDSEYQPDPTDDARPMFDTPDLADVLGRIDRRISEEWPGLAGEVRRALPSGLSSFTDLSEHPLLDALDVALERAETFKGSLDRADRLDARASVGYDR